MVKTMGFCGCSLQSTQWNLVWRKTLFTCSQYPGMIRTVKLLRCSSTQFWRISSQSHPSNNKTPLNKSHTKQNRRAVPGVYSNLISFWREGITRPYKLLTGHFSWLRMKTLKSFSVHIKSTSTPWCSSQKVMEKHDSRNKLKSHGKIRRCQTNQN